MNRRYFRSSFNLLSGFHVHRKTGPTPPEPPTLHHWGSPWRRYLSQRLEVSAAAAAMFLAGLSWGWVLALSYIHHWPSGPLLTWMTLPVLMTIGAMAWAGAVHWSTRWDDAWGARLTEARLGLSPAGQALLEAWCKDGRAVLVRDIRTLERAERRELQARAA